MGHIAPLNRFSSVFVQILFAATWERARRAGHAGPLSKRRLPNANPAFHVAIGQPALPRRHDQSREGRRAPQTEVEQCRAEALVGVSELRSGELDLARRRLHRGGRLLAVARASRVLLVATLMTAASQERIDLGLDRLLHKKADGDAPDLLEDASEVAIAAEQRVDLCANALVGGYSRCYGCRSSFVSWCP
jgi:hypothetical protein